MPLDATIQASADTALTALVDNLRARQTTVRDGITKRYRQCICDASWGTWDAYKPAPAVVTAWVDEYLAPDGAGWSVTGEVTNTDGLTWRRTVHVAGPELWRDTRGWVQIEEQ